MWKLDQGCASFQMCNTCHVLSNIITVCQTELLTHLFGSILFCQRGIGENAFRFLRVHYYVEIRSRVRYPCPNTTVQDYVT